MSISVSTSQGGAVPLSQSDVDALASGLRGQLLNQESAGYNEARTIWNAMIDRRPALIARCAGAADVTRVVRFAAERDLLLSIRGGGHNIAGSAVCDGGIMIDLTPMKSVRVDPVERRARVEPGVTLREFDAEAQAFGLATPLGINSTTGVAGLTVGGGFGWLSRKYGLTIDNLISADVVLATGELVRASAYENPDLFWAIRGGGGNFGVVTSFEFQMHNVGPQVLSGLIVHPLAAAKDVLQFYRDFVERTPEEFVCWFVLRQAPPLPFLSPEWHGKEILGLAVCYNGDLHEGELVAEPLRAFGKPLADVVAPTPFTAWQQVLDPLLTPGARNYWKSHDFRKIDDGLIDAFIDAAKRIPDPQTELAFAQLGGAVARVPAEATAYTHRDASFLINVHGRWADPAKDQKCIGWARDVLTATEQYSTGGVYVNFLTQEEEGRVTAAYGSNFQRLVELKQRFDPNNLFRVNMNIKAAGVPA